MRRTQLILVGLLAGLLYSCATFPTDYGKYKTFAYGGVLMDNKKISLLGMTIRPEEQIVGLPLKPKVIDKKYFYLTDWKPGRYYVETITFLGPWGALGSDKQLTYKLNKDQRLFFEVQENSITNMFSYHCEIVHEFLKPPMLKVISSDDPEIDKMILKALMEEAKDGVWYQHLNDYYDYKYNNGKDSRATSI